MIKGCKLDKWHRDEPIQLVRLDESPAPNEYVNAIITILDSFGIIYHVLTFPTVVALIDYMRQDKTSSYIITEGSYDEEWIAAIQEQLEHEEFRDYKKLCLIDDEGCNYYDIVCPENGSLVITYPKAERAWDLITDADIVLNNSKETLNCYALKNIIFDLTGSCINYENKINYYNFAELKHQLAAQIAVRNMEAMFNDKTT